MRDDKRDSNTRISYNGQTVTRCSIGTIQPVQPMRRLATTRASNALTKVTSIGATAKRIGCSASAIQGFRAGRFKPTAQLRERIRDEFGIPIGDWDVPETRELGAVGIHRILPEGVTIDRMPDGFRISIPAEGGALVYVSRVAVRQLAEDSARRTAGISHRPIPTPAEPVIFAQIRN